MAQNVRNLSQFSVFSQIRRSISSTVRKCKDKVVCEAPVGAQAAAAESIGSHTVAVTAFQKRILVWGKRYKNVSEVPDVVPVEKLHKANDLFRIRMATYSVGAISLVALIMIISGKNAASRGDSVEKHNIDWHKDWQKKHAEEIAQK